MPSSVSVVMTAYNTQRFVERALRSVLRSTHKELDVVVIDDGSTDRTGDIIDQLARRESRVVVEHRDHRGRRDALVRAHELASGDVFVWVDSDDVVHPNGIGECVAQLDDEHQLIYTWRDLIDAQGQRRGAHLKNDLGYSPLQLLVDNMIFHLRMYTRELFDAAGGVGDLESAIDWDQNLRMCEHTTPQLVPKILYSYRVRPGRMSGTPSQARDAASAIRAAICRRSLDVELVVNASGFHLRNV